MSQSANPMVSPRVTKVTVNIGVGEGGQRLQLAEQALEMVTGMTPVRTLATSTNRDLGTRKGSPIGCKADFGGVPEPRAMSNESGREPGGPPRRSEGEKK